MSGLPSQAHGMMTMPNLAEVFQSLNREINAGNVSKVASWLKFIPQKGAKLGVSELSPLYASMVGAIKVGDPAMLAVLFSGNKRLGLLLRQNIAHAHQLLAAAHENGRTGVLDAFLAVTQDSEQEFRASLYAQAAYAGCAALTKRLDGLVEWTPEAGDAAMRAAIGGGSLEIIQSLWDKGVRFDGSARCSAFHVGVKTLPILPKLQAMGLDLNVKSVSMSSPALEVSVLHEAISLGNFELASGLLSAGANPNLATNNTSSALASLLRMYPKKVDGVAEMVREMLDAGAEFKLQDGCSGFSDLLKVAAYFGAMKVMERGKEDLAGLVCDTGLPVVGSIFSSYRAANRMGAMHLAAAGDSAKSVVFLCDLGLDVDGPPGSCSTLEVAARCGATSALAVLLERGANRDIEVDGKSLLKWADKAGLTEVVRLLRAADMSDHLMDAMAGDVDSKPSVSDLGLL